MKRGKGEKAVWEAREITETDLQIRGEEKRDRAEIWRLGGRPGTSVTQEPKITGVMRARVEQAIRRCLRSKQQQAVIIGLFLDQKGLKEVADLLGKKVENVYVLKSRALARLRECEEFLRVLEDLL